MEDKKHQTILTESDKGKRNFRNTRKGELKLKPVKNEKIMVSCWNNINSNNRENIYSNMKILVFSPWKRMVNSKTKSYKGNSLHNRSKKIWN